MSKKPSEATQLRTAKRRIAELERQAAYSREQCISLQTRANKAEQEAQDWRRRFDLLLIREPIQTPQQSGNGGSTGDHARWMGQCVELLRRDPQRNFIEAIKLHRQLFGSSLKESKDAMDAERAKLHIGQSASC